METKIGEQSLQKLAKIINGAENTKIAIIGVAQFEDKYREAKEIQQQQGETQEEQEFNYETDFNPEEIEKLVMNRRPLGKAQEEENRKIALQPTRNNERLKDKDIIQFNTQEKEER